MPIPASIEIMAAPPRTAPPDSKRKKKRGSAKKAERLVYQLSCKKCHGRHGEYVGATTGTLPATMKGHVDRVVAEVRRGRAAKGAEDGPPSSSDIKAGDQERWSADFARHFADHCLPKNRFRRPMSEKQVLKFCRENVKVELLRRKDGDVLCWDCDDEFTDVHRSLLVKRGSRGSDNRRVTPP